MPPHERIGPHNRQKLAPVDKRRKQNKGDSRGVVRAVRSGLALDITGELFSEEEVFRRQLRTALQHQSHEAQRVSQKSERRSQHVRRIITSATRHHRVDCGKRGGVIYCGRAACKGAPAAPCRELQSIHGGSIRSVEPGQTALVTRVRPCASPIASGTSYPGANRLRLVCATVWMNRGRLEYWRRTRRNLSGVHRRAMAWRWNGGAASGAESPGGSPSRLV